MEQLARVRNSFLPQYLIVLTRSVFQSKVTYLVQPQQHARLSIRVAKVVVFGAYPRLGELLDVDEAEAVVLRPNKTRSLSPAHVPQFRVRFLQGVLVRCDKNRNRKGVEFDLFFI